MDEYVTILECENTECPNVGTILNDENVNDRFKKAIEAHFDCELISFSFIDKDLDYLGDCIHASPIDVLVKLSVNGDISEHKVELSQTWLY